MTSGQIAELVTAGVAVLTAFAAWLRARTAHAASAAAARQAAAALTAARLAARQTGPQP